MAEILEVFEKDLTNLKPCKMYNKVHIGILFTSFYVELSGFITIQH